MSIIWYDCTNQYEKEYCFKILLTLNLYWQKTNAVAWLDWAVILIQLLNVECNLSIYIDNLQSHFICSFRKTATLSREQYFVWKIMLYLLLCKLFQESWFEALNKILNTNHNNLSWYSESLNYIGPFTSNWAVVIRNSNPNNSIGTA